MKLEKVIEYSLYTELESKSKNYLFRGLNCKFQTFKFIEFKKKKKEFLKRRLPVTYIKPRGGGLEKFGKEVKESRKWRKAAQAQLRMRADHKIRVEIR